MCGLAGVIIKDKNRSAGRMADIQNLVSELLVAAEVRGNHASGMAIVDRTGEYLIHKRPMSATVMTKTDDYNAALDLVDENTGAVIGHTRFATQGSPKVNKNNHPIRAGNVIGAHNGWVSNDDELFEKYNLKRFAEVDSEVLFRMIDSADTPETFFKDMLKNVSGKVSMVWSDVEKPEYVYVFKGNNPLEMVHIKSLGILVYASTNKILYNAIKWAGMNRMKREKVELKDWTVMRINTGDFQYKKTGGIKIAAPVVRKYSAYDAYSGKYNGYSWGGNTTYTKPKNKPKTAKNGCDTVQGFVPRYSYKDKMVKTADGSQVRIFDFNNKKKGGK